MMWNKKGAGTGTSIWNKQYSDEEILKAQEDAKLIGGASGAFLLGDQNNVGSQVLGGALTGFSMGGPLGALLGIGGGLLGASKRRSSQQAYDRMIYDNNISTKTVQPSYYAKNGGIVESLDGEAIPTQSQKGEVAALPSGAIVGVHSKKMHNEMKKKDVTDYIPSGTFIGDDTKLTKEAADKIIIGASPGIYSEIKSKNIPYKEIKLGDALKKKTFTSAEGLEAIRDYIKIPQELERGISDPFAKITAKENLGTRGKFISGLMELTSKNNKKLRKQIADATEN